MNPERVETLIIGAGLAGLSAAVRLHEAGREVAVVDAADAVGGRVRTDLLDGFILDRGFQVYLDAYPEAGSFLDLAALDLQAFEPGACVWRKGKLRRLVDVFRRPGALFSTAIQPVGNLLDKLLVAKLRSRLQHKTLEAIAAEPQITTADYLRNFGFSEKMIDFFFRGFYGGIFLEDHLVTSSRMFEFTFGMFSRGSATLPARGMQSIPEQIASRLPEGIVTLNQHVDSIEGTSARIGDRVISADHLIVATDGEAAADLLPGRNAPHWNQTFCLYFSADEDPLGESMLALRGDRDGLINHVCVPSTICPGYAPAGKSLISVNLIGDRCGNVDPVPAVLEELESWFGPVVHDWVPLRTYHIPKALPTPTPGHLSPPEQQGNVFLCGDHTTSASIEGAIRSGLATATRILDGKS